MANAAELPKKIVCNAYIFTKLQAIVPRFEPVWPPYLRFTTDWN